MKTKTKIFRGFYIISVLVIGLAAYTSRPKQAEDNGQDSAKSVPSQSVSLPASLPPDSTASSNESNSQSPGKPIKSSTVVTTSSPEVIIAQATSQQVSATVAGKAADGNSLVIVNAGQDSPLIQGITSSGNADVQPNHRYIPAVDATDPFYDSQWALDAIDAPQAWDITTGSSGVTLAVIDSGVLFSQTINGTTYSQPDFPVNRQFTNNGEQGTTQSGDTCWTGSPDDKETNDCDDDSNGYIDDINGWDFMGGFRGASAACPNFANSATYQSVSDANYLTADNDPQPYSCDSPITQTALNKTHYDGTCTMFVSACTVGHGTSVASVAASEANDGNLIAGLDHHAKIMNLRVFDGYGYTDSAHIAAAITYAADNGANVINLSLSYTTCDGSFSDNTIENALIAAKAAGATIVAASGNNNATIVCYPASSTSVIAAGASSEGDNRASFSSYGPQLEVLAPGQSVLAATAPSSYLNSNISSVSGTSFASPYTAGLASLLLAEHPLASPDQIKTWITERADIVDGMANFPRTNAYGSGRINAYTSLRVAAGDLPVYFLRAGNPQIGRDETWTDDITERNTILNANKQVYAGISFWHDGNDYEGSLEEYRKDNTGL